MSFTHLRSRIHKKKEKHSDRKTPPVLDDQFYDISDTVSMCDSISSRFTNDDEKDAYEDHLAQIQEQLVSVMIEKQNLEQELKQYKENLANEKLKEELQLEKKKNKSLQDQLKKRSPKLSRDSKQKIEKTPKLQQLVEETEVEPIIESQAVAPRSRYDRFFERTFEVVYDFLEDLNDMTRPEDNKGPPDEPLSVKRLKENIKRFRTAVKPITDTWKGLHNMFTWKTRSYTLFVFLIHMYCVWKGWFLPLLFFLGAIRMVVNFLHFKGYKFDFAYLDPGDPEKETDDSLGLSDKFNLVLLVATKVQNGLGSVADSLEKIKNLLTWKHQQGSKLVLKIMCIGFVTTAVLPTSILWRIIGLGLGIKIFIVNYIYNRYPRIRKRYDSNYKLWLSLPTDAEHDRNLVKTEMDKYIVIPRTESELERALQDQSSDSDSSEGDDSAEFRQVFSLPVTECPQRGWLRGKRCVLIGKDKSILNLLSKKRGKLFLTNSFLCFEREKTPSLKNIVIPLQDIMHIDKVKVYHRLPGKGVAIQILISSEGKEKVLVFGGIIGREDVVKTINQSVGNVKQERQSGRKSCDSVSRRSISSLESTSSKIQNFTFGAYYEDSDSD